MTNGLAYCIYGNFNWPPAPDGAKVKPIDKAPGCVVIRYVKTGDFYRGWMAWVPANELASIDKIADLPKPPEDGHGESLYSKSPEENIWNDFKPNVIATYWLDEVKGKPKIKARVMFAGAALLERFDLGGGDAPAFRLPLATEFAFEGNNGKTSRVIFGQPTTHYLRLDLGVPVPFVQRNTSKSGEERVFPFSAFFQLSEPKEPLQADDLRLGGDWLGTKNTEKMEVRPKDKRALGEFGFAVRGQTGPTPYAFIPNSDAATGYWPVQYKGNVPVVDHLKRLGFTAANKSDFSFLQPPKPEEAVKEELGFEFLSTGGLVYRMAQNVMVVGPVAPKPGDDVRIVKGTTTRPKVGRLGLRFRHDLGAWLDTGAAGIITEVTIRWNGKAFKPSDLGKAMQERGSVALDPLLESRAETHVRWEQIFEETFAHKILTDPPLNVLTNPHEVLLHEPPNRDNETDALIDGAVMAMRHARLALQQAEGARPQSFLPELMLKGKVQRVHMVLQAQSMQVALDSNGLLDWHNEPRAGKVQFRLTMAPGANNALALRAWFPAALAEIPPETRHAHIKLEHDPKALAYDEDQSFASFKIVNDPHLNDLDSIDHVAEDHRGREFLLGALRLVSDGPVIFEDEDNNTYSRLAISRGRVAAAQIGTGRPAIVAPLGVNLFLRLAISRVLPHTVDHPRDARVDRPTPILISPDDADVPESGKVASGGFILDVNERFGDRRDWQMTARLSDDIADGDDRLIHRVVLSEEPMSLLRFSRRPLSREGDAGSAIVAEYDSVSRTWEFRNPGTYRYTLPAQSIGEGADKPRRLELHDPQDADLGSHRPYPMDGVEPRDKSSYLVDFRLTPPADVWINPSDVERGFVLPEWSAHEIFRQHGAFGLGVGLQGLRAEFLYGLSVGIDTGRETGPARLARVAEIEALTGRWKGSRITSNDLVAELVALEDGPWAVWKGGDPITARMVASLLKPYGVKPERDRASRFYVLDDLRDAVGRYVS